MENWLGLHPSSHSCRNILSIILRPSLTREMTTPHSTTPNHTTVPLSEMATPRNTIPNHTSQYHTTLLVSTEDPSTLKHEEYMSNGRGSWPVIAGGDRTNDQLVTELWSCQCTIPCYTWIFHTVSSFMHDHARNFIQLSLYHDVFSYINLTMKAQNVVPYHTMPAINDPRYDHTNDCRTARDPTRDYAVHLSPRAKLPRTIYVLLSSLCLCTNTNMNINTIMLSICSRRPSTLYN